MANSKQSKGQVQPVELVKGDTKRLAYSPAEQVHLEFQGFSLADPKADLVAKASQGQPAVAAPTPAAPVTK